MNEERNELNAPSGFVVLPCPICGNDPDVETLGSCIDIECCVSMSRQKCDYLTIAERETWSNEDIKYSDAVESKVLKEVRDEWNTRAPQNAQAYPSAQMRDST